MLNITLFKVYDTFECKVFDIYALSLETKKYNGWQQ